MDLLEFNTHSFIVKIWLEETVEEAGRAVWRGHITHVPSGKRRYLEELGDITDFVAPYLEGMGVRFPKYRRVKQWSKRLKGRLRRILKKVQEERHLVHHDPNP